MRRSWVKERKKKKKKNTARFSDSLRASGEAGGGFVREGVRASALLPTVATLYPVVRSTLKKKKILNSIKANCQT